MHPAMMRIPGFAFLLSIGLSLPALAQTTAPSATPMTGGVGSATLRNGFPAGGGAVALPSVQNSSTASSSATGGAPHPPPHPRGTTSSPTASTTSTGTTGRAGGGAGGNTGTAATTGTMGTAGSGSVSGGS